MTFTLLLVFNITGWILFIIIQRWLLGRTLNPQKVLKDIESELDSILTEMNGTTERNIRLIEDSVRRLKEQIAGADKRIKVLQGEDEKRSRVGSDYSHLSSRKPITLQVVDEPEVKAVTKEPDKVEESINSRIISFHRQGLEPRLIAGKVGIPLGEVELIISLSEPADR